MNSGEIAGDEVIQLYFADKQATVVRPNKELAGFLTVSFSFAADQTAFIDKDMKWRVEAGDVDIFIGNSSDNLCLAGTITILDTVILPNSKRTYYSDVINYAINEI